jgi:hypothetical protein
MIFQGNSSVILTELFQQFIMHHYASEAFDMGMISQLIKD